MRRAYATHRELQLIKAREGSQRGEIGGMNATTIGSRNSWDTTTDDGSNRYSYCGASQRESPARSDDTKPSRVGRRGGLKRSGKGSQPSKANRNIPGGWTVVRFSTVTIRNYDITLGDNPAVTAGPPIQLDWKYEQLPLPLSIDEFESFRLPRRQLSTRYLIIAPDFRRGVLLRTGFTHRQIDKTERAVEKIQQQRQRTSLGFPFYRIEYAVRSAGRKIQRSTTKVLHSSGLSKDKSSRFDDADEKTVHTCIEEPDDSEEMIQSLMLDDVHETPPSVTVASSAAIVNGCYASRRQSTCVVVGSDASECPA